MKLSFYLVALLTVSSMAFASRDLTPNEYGVVGAALVDIVPTYQGGSAGIELEECVVQGGTALVECTYKVPGRLFTGKVLFDETEFSGKNQELVKARFLSLQRQ